MGRKSKETIEEERRAALTPEERTAEDAAKLEEEAKKLAEEGDKKPPVPGADVLNTPPPAPSKKGETVEVSKEDLAKLLEKLDRQAKDIEILYKASDKGNMAKVLGQGGEILIKKVNLWTWDNTGVIVIATELKTNRCEVVMGKWYEDQNVMVVLEDGKTFEAPYIEFSRKILNKIPAEIISTSKSFDKNKKEVILYKVQLENGKELEINAAFVN